MFLKWHEAPRSQTGEEIPTILTSNHLFHVCLICRYVIKDKSSGDQLYSVFEGESGSEICCQQCCGGHRPFNLTLVDKFKREIIKIKRSSVACDCCCGLMDCCDRVEVYVRNYKTMRFDWKLVGSVRKYWCPLFPYFGICNENGGS